MCVTGTSWGLVLITSGRFVPGFVKNEMISFLTYDLIAREFEYLICNQLGLSYEWPPRLPRGHEFGSHWLSWEPSVPSAHETSLFHHLLQRPHAIALL